MHWERYKKEIKFDDIYYNYGWFRDLKKAYNIYSKKPNLGVPQGYKLGPLLFLLYAMQSQVQGGGQGT